MEHYALSARKLNGCMLCGNSIYIAISMFIKAELFKRFMHDFMSHWNQKHRINFVPLDLNFMALPFLEHQSK